MASTMSSTSNPSCKFDIDCWSYESILSLVSDVTDLALESGDKAIGAKIFWREWQATENHFPADMRKKFVNFMDKKLNEKGFPSLLSC